MSKNFSINDVMIALENYHMGIDSFYIFSAVQGITISLNGEKELFSYQEVLPLLQMAPNFNYDVDEYFYKEIRY